MSTLKAVLLALANLGRVPDGPGSAPFSSVCVVSEPHEPDVVTQAWSGREALPAELGEFWRLTGGARLFEDPDYGQLGLVLLSTAASRDRTDGEYEARPDEITQDDIVFGEFLGDQELLIYSGVEGVLVALPLDDRVDWYRAAPTRIGFLERFSASQGEKFWEGSS